MKPAKFGRSAVAFTLVEMLVVIGIIGILAALLLPALSASQLRAKRIVCESQLRQMGIAFQSFAHDHNGKFPMQVATNDGGSREFVQNGHLMNGPFYFAFRHFQPLAGILDTPKILVCPADTRSAATTFAALQNSNLSYFVGVSAEYSQPMSALAGDGNLAAASTIVRGAVGRRLTWTGQQHRFKGNLLFADGHVEEWGNHGVGTLSRSGNFVLPTIGNANKPSQIVTADSQTETTVRSAATNHEAVQTHLVTERPNSSLDTPPAFHPLPASNVRQTELTAGEPNPAEISNPTSESGGSAEVKSSSSTAPPEKSDNSLMSPRQQRIAQFLRGLLVGTCLLILLALLLYAAYRTWRWRQNPARKRSSKVLNLEDWDR